jgi:transposase
VVHVNARTNLFARRLIVERVAAGWPAAHVAEQLGVSRATVHKWLRRYGEGGEAALADRSSRPVRMPARTRSRSSRRCWPRAGGASGARSCRRPSSG